MNGANLFEHRSPVPYVPVGDKRNAVDWNWLFG
jgi:hypothetical protein